MRPSLYGVLLATAVLVGGCSHLSIEHDQDWPGTTRSANAVSLDTAAQNRGDWSSIIKQRGGEPSDLIVTPVSAKGPHAVAHSDSRYLLDSGDQLRIFVYGQPNLSRIYTVDHSGKIMVPLIGVVRAQRRTTYQLAAAIRSRLGARFVRDPNVTVDMHQNRPFFILGEVRNPGQYPYVHGMTVETAVAIAGGYTPRADKLRFRVNRRVDGIVEVDQGTATYVVQPGDTVSVSERFF